MVIISTKVPFITITVFLKNICNKCFESATVNPKVRDNFLKNNYEWLSTDSCKHMPENIKHFYKQKHANEQMQPYCKMLCKRWHLILTNDQCKNIFILVNHKHAWWSLTFQRTPVDQSTDMTVIHAGRPDRENLLVKIGQSHTFLTSEHMFACIQIFIIVKEWSNFKNGTNIEHSGKKRDYKLLLKCIMLEIYTMKYYNCT